MQIRRTDISLLLQKTFFVMKRINKVGNYCCKAISVLL